MLTLPRQRFPVVLVLALLAGAPAALAQPTVAVVPFAGPRAAQVHQQVVKGVCAAATCVPGGGLLAKGKIRWPAVRKQKVQLLLSGRVLGPADKRVLRLDAQNAAQKRLFRLNLPLDKRGRLSAASLDQVVARVQEHQALEESPLAPLPPPPAPPVEAPPPLEQAPLAEVPETDPDDPTEPPLPPPVRFRAQPLLVAELGSAFIHRSLRYFGPAENLRSYATQPALLAPRLRAEVYPLASITSGVTAGLGLELDYLAAIFLRSVDEEDRTYSTRFSRFDVGVRWNLEAPAGLPLRWAPALGLRGGGFRVRESADGMRLSGMPGLSYDAVRAGVELEHARAPFVVRGRAEYLHGLGLGELGSADFFPAAKARSVELQAGLGYLVIPAVELRASLHYTRYGFTFSPEEGAPYQAKGGADQQLGGSVGARFTY